MKGPFFTIVDKLAKAPDGLRAIESDKGIRAEFEALNKVQRTAILSGDWGEIQRQLIVEHPNVARLSDNPEIGWNLWKLATAGADQAQPPT